MCSQILPSQLTCSLAFLKGIFTWRLKHNVTVRMKCKPKWFISSVCHNLSNLILSEISVAWRIVLLETYLHKISNAIQFFSLVTCRRSNLMHYSWMIIVHNSIPSKWILCVWFYRWIFPRKNKIMWWSNLTYCKLKN